MSRIKLPILRISNVNRPRVVRFASPSAVNLGKNLPAASSRR